jgi:hypothetical protein
MKSSGAVLLSRRARAVRATAATPDQRHELAYCVIRFPGDLLPYLLLISPSADRLDGDERQDS